MSIYEDVYSSLEKPIEYLKNKSNNDELNIIKLTHYQRESNNKDAFSSEILRLYEKFLKSVSSSPCFKANVMIYTNDTIVGNILFNTVCGSNRKRETGKCYCENVHFMCWMNMRN